MADLVATHIKVPDGFRHPGKASTALVDGHFAVGILGMSRVNGAIAAFKLGDELL